LFFENEYRLTPFRIDKTEPDWVLTLEAKDQLSAPEGNLVSNKENLHFWVENGRGIHYIDVRAKDWSQAAVRVDVYRNVNHAEVKRDRFSSYIPVKYVLKCMMAEHMIARNHGFVFHCSYINKGGKAILFTAPSETGKSTQAELWNKYRGTEIVNGDRAAVRLADGILLAEGIPFAGSSEYCKNQSLPIEAIVYLQQAPGTTIHKLRGYEAFARIWEGVSVNTWDRMDMKLVSAVVQKAAAELPVFHLSCTPDETAVTVLEEALRKQVNP